MKLVTIIRQSLKAIFANKGRSFLTILGIIIGIGSVIALISLGTGVRASISDRISTLGATNIIVLPGSGFRGGSSSSSGNQGRGPQGGLGETASTLTLQDLRSLSDTAKHPKIRRLTGQISGSTVLTTTAGGQRFTALGTSDSYFGIENLSIQDGRLYNAHDINTKAKAVVLGNQLAKDVYGNKNPVGETLTVENTSYNVIGVLKKANESGFSNPNNQAFIPYTAAQQTFNTDNFSSIIVQAKTEGDVNKAKDDITKTLLANHKITNSKLADFNVNSSADLLSTVNQITGILTSLLAGIAAISLVVGGIGIMNIMLVSVTERTREIGLRKAVGAKTSDILGQFIAEALLLTVFGGLIGIGLGVLVGRLIAPSIGFTPIVTTSAILLAVGVSSAVGLIFGIYPAARAALLNPIDALRYE
ncbi:MAG TPA: ABC transporter permease [Candidatus Aquicultor sp.]|jgi:putative ABC transport system permease protein